MISVLGSESLSLPEIEAFLGASDGVRFQGGSRSELYAWVERLVCPQEHAGQTPRVKGLLRAYVERMTGLSRAQTTRLVGSYLKTGQVRARAAGGHRFQRRYTPADAALLATVDLAHDCLSGPATRHISEAYLLPVLYNILHQFPFAILNFHSDNGSEFLNAQVARMLEKLRVEQTKSRPRHCGDNGLVEAKNAAIVRKHKGWGHIDPSHAERLNQFYTSFLNPYVNYHRPSAQPETDIDPRGRKRTFCRNWLTPLEKLLTLHRPQQYLKPGITLQTLRRIAAARSDTECATRLQTASTDLAQRLQSTA